MTHVGSPNASEIYGNLRALNAFGTSTSVSSHPFSFNGQLMRDFERRRSWYPYVGYYRVPSSHAELDEWNPQVVARCKLRRKFIVPYSHSLILLRLLSHWRISRTSKLILFSHFSSKQYDSSATSSIPANASGTDAVRDELSAVSSKSVRSWSEKVGHVVLALHPRQWISERLLGRHWCL